MSEQCRSCGASIDYALATAVRERDDLKAKFDERIEEISENYRTVRAERDEAYKQILEYRKMRNSLEAEVDVARGRERDGQ